MSKEKTLSFTKEESQYIRLALDREGNRQVISDNREIAEIFMD